MAVLEFEIDGLSCASCVGRVERALGAVPGVLQAQANFATGRADVRFLAGATTPAELARAASDAGYAATVREGPTERSGPDRDAAAGALRGRLIVAAALTLPVFVLEMGSPVVPGMADRIHATIGREASWWLQAALTTVVLATPTSIMVGTGRAAELGVLFRQGDALQALQGAEVIALDKTGTLTEGRPELTALVPAPGWERDDALRLAAAVEARSEHPVARAILRAARGLDLPEATAFEAHAGLGATADVEGRAVLIGAERFLLRRGIDPAPLRGQADAIGAEGRTPLWLAVDGRVAAAIGVDDPVKGSTPEAIRAFHEMGLEVAMITGDAEATARAVAARLGIDHVVAEVMPGGKVDAVRALRAAHGAVAFVGDGINDAPALAEADVGIAIGTGTDVAIEAADVVLMAGELDAVIRALAISRATMRNIRQNLFWAFAYNAALIPVAAGLLYPLTGALLSPMLAAGAMALSSVFVLSNALRLRRAVRSPRSAAEPASIGREVAA